MNRLEFIFKTVNAIASKKYDATIEHMLARAVLSEIDVAKRKRGAGYQQGMATISLSFGDLLETDLTRRDSDRLETHGNPFPSRA